MEYDNSDTISERFGVNTTKSKPHGYSGKTKFQAKLPEKEISIDTTYDTAVSLIWRSLIRHPDEGLDYAYLRKIVVAKPVLFGVGLPRFLNTSHKRELDVSLQELLNEDLIEII
jgi:hypothetical protein